MLLSIIADWIYTLRINKYILKIKSLNSDSGLRTSVSFILIFLKFFEDQMNILLESQHWGLVK